MREFTEEEREEHRLRMQKLKEQNLQREAEIKKEEATQPSTQTPQPQQQPQVDNKQNQNFHRDMKLDWNPAKWAYMSGMGTLDVPFDLIGTVPGLGGIDDTWDRITRFDNPNAAKFRSAASVIVPSIILGSKYAKFHAGRNLTGLNGAVQNVGGQALINSVIGGLSDYGEDPSNRLITHPDNFKRLSETWPEYFGPDGHFPDVASLADADATHPVMNRFMAAADEGLLQGFGDIVGYMLNAGKPILRNMIPVTRESKAYKFKTQLQHLERDTKKRIIDIDEAIASNTLAKEEVEALGKEKSKLIQQATQTGSSDATQNAGDSFLKERQRQRKIYLNNRALRTIANDPNVTSFDPAITPKLASEKQLTGIASTAPGASVKNAIDVDMRQRGYVDPLSAPTNPITNAMEDGMLLGKSSRTAVRWIADKVKAASGYRYVQATARGTSESVNDAAYEIYNKWMKTGTGDELRELMKDPMYRDPRRLRDTLNNAVTVEVLDDAGAARAAALMINDLTNLYLGRELAESSARVMDTLGAQVAAKSGAPEMFKNLLDDERVFKNVVDKLEILTEEYGLAKYISGWSLKEKRWWKNPDFIASPLERIKITHEEFLAKNKQLKSDFKAFRTQLDDAAAQDPKLARTLMKAYDATDGNVDTLMKLNAYAKYHLSPMGLLWNREAKELGISGWKMNQFAKGAWAVTYNSVLSGLAALRAAVGNGMMLVFKPISALQRAGFSQLLGKDKDALERVVYMYGNMHETARRAWGDALTRMKKVHQDPDFMMKAARKDFVVEDSSAWEVLDDLAETWQKEGDHYGNFMYGWANFQRKVSRQPWLRTGITAMSGIDAYTDTFMSTYMSRVKAYDDTIKQLGKKADPLVFEDALKRAEKLNHDTMFDAQGLLKDKAAKYASGEIALNLDEGFSNWINPALNKFPVFKSLMMFPRTSMNQIKLAMSYTPLAAIPGLGKYGDTLLAGTNRTKIAKVLADHGVDLKTTPNAMAIYKELRREYEGRLMMGGATATLAFGYAMAGNIRGNGPANHIELVKLKKKNWKPHTIKVGNNWVSYKGIPVVEQYFSLMGDLAYYSSALGKNMTETFINKTAWTITATYLNGTPLQGMEPLHAAMKGDEGALQRLFAGQLRAAIPLSGAHAIVAKTITNAQKEIYKDFWGYVRNSTVFKDMSYSKIDHWTGEEIDEIDNPILRFLNAMNPIKIHGGNEKWRTWLIDSGFNDLNEIKKNSRTGEDYSPEARELIGRYMGEDQLWKQIERRFMDNDEYNEQLDGLRKFIMSGKEFEEVGMYANKLKVYRDLKKMINQSKVNAEARIAKDPRYKHLNILGVDSKRTGNLMYRGRINEAAESSKKNYKKKQEFLKYGVK